MRVLIIVGILLSRSWFSVGFVGHVGFVRRAHNLHNLHNSVVTVASSHHDITASNKEAKVEVENESLEDLAMNLRGLALKIGAAHHRMQSSRSSGNLKVTTPPACRALIHVLHSHTQQKQQQQQQQLGGTCISSMLNVQQGVSKACSNAVQLAGETNDYVYIDQLMHQLVQFALRVDQASTPILDGQIFATAIEALSNTNAGANKLRRMWALMLHYYQQQEHTATDVPGTSNALNAMIAGLAHPKRNKIRAALKLYYDHVNQQQNNIVNVDSFTVHACIHALTQAIQLTNKPHATNHDPQQHNHSPCWQWNEAMQVLHLAAQYDKHAAQTHLAKPRLLNNYVFSAVLKLNDKASTTFPPHDKQHYMMDNNNKNNHHHHTCDYHDGPSFALALLQQMKNEGVSPDVKTCTQILSACAPKPNHDGTTTSTNRWKDACALLHLMRQALHHTTNHNNHHHHNNNNNKHEQEQEQEQTPNVPWSLPPPNAYAYAAAISTCAKAGQSTKAVQLLLDMRQDAIVSLDQHQNTITNNNNNNNNNNNITVAMTDSHTDRVKSKQHPPWPTTWVYNAALSALLPSGHQDLSNPTPAMTWSTKIDMITTLLAYMERDARQYDMACIPNTITYNTALAALSPASYYYSSTTSTPTAKSKSLLLPENYNKQNKNHNDEKQGEKEEKKRIVHLIRALLQRMDQCGVAKEYKTFYNAISACHGRDVGYGLDLVNLAMREGTGEGGGVVLRGGRTLTQVCNVALKACASGDALSKGRSRQCAVEIFGRMIVGSGYRNHNKHCKTVAKHVPNGQEGATKVAAKRKNATTTMMMKVPADSDTFYFLLKALGGTTTTKSKFNPPHQRSQENAVGDVGIGNAAMTCLQAMRGNSSAVSTLTQAWDIPFFPQPIEVEERHYHAVMTACIQNSHQDEDAPDLTLHVLDMMRGDGLSKPSRNTYVALIYAFCHAAMEQALDASKPKMKKGEEEEGGGRSLQEVIRQRRRRERMNRRIRKKKEKSTNEGVNGEVDTLTDQEEVTRNDDTASTEVKTDNEKRTKTPTMSAAQARARAALKLLPSVPNPDPPLLSTVSRACASTQLWDEAMRTLRSLHSNALDNDTISLETMSVLPRLHRSLLSIAARDGNVVAALGVAAQVQNLTATVHERANSSQMKSSLDESVVESLVSVTDAMHSQKELVGLDTSKYNPVPHLDMEAEDWKLLMIAASKARNVTACCDILATLKPYVVATRRTSSLSSSSNNHKVPQGRPQPQKDAAALAGALTSAVLCFEAKEKASHAVRSVRAYVTWSQRRPPLSAVVAACRVAALKGRGRQVCKLVSLAVTAKGDLQGRATAAAGFKEDISYEQELYGQAVTALYKNGDYHRADELYAAAVRSGALPWAVVEQDMDQVEMELENSSRSLSRFKLEEQIISSVNGKISILEETDKEHHEMENNNKQRTSKKKKLKKKKQKNSTARKDKELMLDLHGMTTAIAHSAVRLALQQEIQLVSIRDTSSSLPSSDTFSKKVNVGLGEVRWNRDVTIVTGRGKKSSRHLRPVLRPEVQRMLMEEFYPPLSTSSLKGNMGALKIPAEDVEAWLSFHRQQRDARMLEVAGMIRNIWDITTRSRG